MNETPQTDVRLSLYLNRGRVPVSLAPINERRIDGQNEKSKFPVPTN